MPLHNLFGGTIPTHYSNAQMDHKLNKYSRIWGTFGRTLKTKTSTETHFKFHYAVNTEVNFGQLKQATQNTISTDET
jgi:hypothetical protein